MIQHVTVVFAKAKSAFDRFTGHGPFLYQSSKSCKLVVISQAVLGSFQAGVKELSQTCRRVVRQTSGPVTWLMVLTVSTMLLRVVTA